MSGRRRSASPRNKRPAPRSYDYDRYDRNERYDRNDRSERYDRERYDRGRRRNERLTDDFGRDVPRETYREKRDVPEKSDFKDVEVVEDVKDAKDTTDLKEQKDEKKLEDKKDLKAQKEDQKEQKDRNAQNEQTAPGSEQTESKTKKKNKKKKNSTPVETNDSDDEFQRMMGMSSASFGSTKHKKVAGNQVGGVSKPKATQYRQYMNRQGGFNRALSPERK
ncbi:hypothetical protein CJU89_4658 [Yarrowia sp. B02]|nr:hypothetical protein CJU89_4658 [Yarrowia sp. B02]